MMETQEFIEEVILNFVKGNDKLTELRGLSVKLRIEEVVEAALDVRDSHKN